MQNEMNIKEDNEMLSARHITSHLSDYVETNIRLAAVNATQKASEVATLALTITLVSLFCLLVLFFAGIGASLWLGELWNNSKAGCFAVAAFFFLILVVFVVLHKKVISPLVRDYFIRKVYA
jgi:hypothetical protein